MSHVSKMMKFLFEPEKNASVGSTVVEEDLLSCIVEAEVTGAVDDDWRHAQSLRLVPFV